MSTVFVGWHQCARPSNTRFLKSTPLAISDGSSIGSAVFARSMTHSPCTPHPPKVCPLPRGSSTWFLGPLRTTTANGNSIESCHFPGLTIATNRRTDRQNGHGSRSVPTSRLRRYYYVRRGLIITIRVRHTCRRTWKCDRKDSLSQRSPFENSQIHCICENMQNDITSRIIVSFRT